jgi:hypothetical protein
MARPGTGEVGKQKAPWPSVQTQLSRAKARRGSQLEKLIRDNQDFQLLDQRESEDDGYGHPLWLRVYWRRTHPDDQYSTVNPGASYPDVLYRIHDWMLSHQDLPLGGPGESGLGGAVPTP